MIQIKQDINILFESTKNSPEHNKDPNALIGYSSNMQDIFKNIEEYNTDKKCIKY